MKAFQITSMVPMPYFLIRLGRCRKMKSSLGGNGQRPVILTAWLSFQKTFPFRRNEPYGSSALKRDIRHSYWSDGENWPRLFNQPVFTVRIATITSFQVRFASRVTLICFASFMTISFRCPPRISAHELDSARTISARLSTF